MIDQLLAIARLCTRLESAARYGVDTYPWATAWVVDWPGLGQCLWISKLDVTQPWSQ